MSPRVGATCAAFAVLIAADLSASARRQDSAGSITGVVRDSASGLPVGYALIIVVGKDQQVFAGESGRLHLL